MAKANDMRALEARSHELMNRCNQGLADEVYQAVFYYIFFEPEGVDSHDDAYNFLRSFVEGDFDTIAKFYPKFNLPPVPEEADMAPMGLMYRYPDCEGHPDYPKSSWKAEVSEGRCTEGYYDWVLQKLKLARQGAEDPVYTKSKWIDAVKSDRILEGYSQWVRMQIKASQSL